MLFRDAGPARVTGHTLRDMFSDVRLSVCFFISIAFNLLALHVFFSVPAQNRLLHNEFHSSVADARASAFPSECLFESGTRAEFCLEAEGRSTKENFETYRLAREGCSWRKSEAFQTKGFFFRYFSLSRTMPRGLLETGEASGRSTPYT